MEELGASDLFPYSPETDGGQFTPADLNELTNTDDIIITPPPYLPTVTDADNDADADNTDDTDSTGNPTAGLGDSLHDLTTTPYGGPSPEQLRQQVEELREKIEQLHPDVVLLARDTSNPDLLTLLAESPDDEVVDEVEHNPHTPTEIVEQLPALREDSTRWGRVKEVLSGDLTDDELKQRADDPSVWVRLATVSRVGTDSETLTKLAQDSNPFVRLYAGIASPTINGKLMKQLKNDPHPLVRYGVRKREELMRGQQARHLRKNTTIGKASEDERLSVAKSRKANPQMLADMSVFEKDKEILAEVAKNPNTPAASLFALTEYTKDKTVLANIASNPNTPTEILGRLSLNPNIGIKAGLAGNPSTSPETVEALLYDRSPSVQAAALNNPNLKITADHLTLYVKAKDWRVRDATAKHKNTSPTALAKLAKDRDVRVRKTVAKNPNTDTETLKRLTRSKDKSVSNTATEELRRRNIASLLNS